MALSWAVLAPGAWPQDDGGLIEEVVVTAAKREQGLYEVPASLSVFDGGALGEQGITDLVDIGKFVPNLVVTTFSAGHTSSANPFIRGIGVQDHLITTDPGIGVYVDGVYLGRQVGQHWNLSNIERVEVLRGPQGTLYGRNAIGGAINIITAAPGSEPGVRIGAEIGSRGRVNADFHGDTRLNDRLAATLSVGIKRRGGIGTFSNLPDAKVEVGETRELFGRMKLAWQPAPAFTLTLAADANDGDNGLNPYTTLINELPMGAVYAAGYRNSDVAANSYDNNTGQADQLRTTNSASGLSATAEWEFAHHWTAKAIGSVRRSKYQAGLDDDGFLDDFLSFPERGEADQASFEAQLHGDFEAWHLVAGFLHFSEDGANLQDPTVFLGAQGRFELSQEVESTALFVNGSRELGSRWRLSGGLRATRDEKRATTDVGTGTVSAKRRWRETSWDFAIHYAATDRLSAYATLQSGYQSGQFPARPYCLFSDPACFTASDNITALNFEAGLKGQPWDGWEMSAAIFHTRYEDLPYQVSTTAGEGFSTVNLIVDQETTGFEWESALHLAGALRLHVTLGYLDVKVARQLGVRPVAPLTPELTLSISPEYRRTLSNGGELAARLGSTTPTGMACGVSRVPTPPG
ncbi:MAG: TonB-dependent receptor [Gammaproteobacteria bacterium]|nr:TonB-dependent receptor [Gammaproteobacteria bacterium]